MASTSLSLVTRVVVVCMTAATIASAQPAPDRGSPPRPPTAEEEARLARADDLYRQGNELVKAGNFVQAHARYREAFSLKESFDIAGNLADMEYELGKFRDAAEHAAYSLKIFPPNGKARAKERTIEILAKAKKQVCTVRVSSNVAGADVSIDGHKVGKTPLDVDLFTEPGERTFRVVALGYKEVTHPRTCAKGADVDVPFTLEALPGIVPTAFASGAPSSSSAPPVPSASTVPPEPRPAWPAIVLGGVAAVGVGAGIGLTVAGAGENSDAIDTFRTCGRSAACEEEAQSSVDTANVLQGVGIAGFAIGAASLTGMIIYLALPSSGPDRAALRLVPFAGPGAQGLSVGGRF